MKILIITQYFWPENFRINDLALALSEKGHDISILTGIPNYPEGSFFKGYGIFSKRKDNYKGIKIYRSILVSRGKSKGIRLIINYLSFAFFASMSILFMINKKFDVVFVYEPSPITVGLPAIVIKKIKKIPICFWVQDLWPESVISAGNIKSKFIIKIILLLVKYIYNNCDKILVQSKGFIQSLVDKGVYGTKLVYYPNWAENIFQAKVSKDDALLKILPKGFIILFAGNIGEAQDFSSILTAAEKIKEHKDIHWVILGNGRKKEWVEEQVQIRGLEKTFHLPGEYPVETMPFFYSKADVLLVSLKNEPIFSLTIPGKVQSYMASGKPILAMLNGEGARIIKEADAGLTCNSGDADGLAANVVKMNKMKKSTLNTFGKNSKKYYQDNFNREHLIDRIEQILQALGGEKG